MKFPNFQFYVYGLFKPIQIFLFLLIIPITNSNLFSQQLAFPTAKGAAAYTTGGRGGQVIHVTTLDWSGAGSFYEALTTAGARTIVFDVSGEIQTPYNDWGVMLQGSSGNYDDVTIAGQTAPEGGITFVGNEWAWYNVDNFIIRYVRIRSTSSSRDAVEFQSCTNGILDHVTISNGGDECVSFSKLGTAYITLQSCYMQDSKTGSIMGGYSSDPNVLSEGEFTVVDNLWQNISHRFTNPAGNGSKHDIINNVIYNHKYRIVNISGAIECNIINNYIKPSYQGLRQSGWASPTSQLSNNLNKIPVGSHNDAERIYAAGTIVTDTHLTAETDDSWMFNTFVSNTPLPEPNNYFVDTQFPLVGRSFTIKTAQQAYTDVLADVGANKYLNADGTYTFWQDGKDASAIQEVINDSYSGSFYDNWNSIPWDAIPSNTRPAGYDTNNDGIADVWAAINIPQGAIHSDIAPNGYTFLENFLNGVDGAMGGTVDAEGVTVIPGTAAINLPETIQLTNEFTPVNSTNQNGVWSTSNDSVAIVDSNGMVSSISEGVATITFTANDGGFSDSSIVTVTNIYIPVTTVTVSPNEISLDINESAQLTANILPSNATNKDCSWTSSNTEVVIVDDQCFVTGLAEGTATITFISEDNNTIFDTATVNVVDAFYGTYEFYNADTDVMIQEIADDENFDLNIIGDQVNIRSIPQGGDTNTNVESVQVEWTGVENGVYIESSPIYAGMTGHNGFDFEPYTVVEGIYDFTVTYFSQNNGTGNVVSTDKFSLTFTTGFTINAGEDQSICEGSNETITLTASPAESYVWNTGETTQSIFVLPNQTTIYTVTGTDSDGNESTDSVTVTVNPLPIANAGEDVEICLDDSITLTASGGDSYEWNNGQSSQSITVSPENTTTYTVTVTNNGCSATDDVVVTVNPRPAINAGNDVEINQNESTTLTASGDGTFVWNTGEETPSITVSPTETTTYTVTATLNGCTISDSVIVTVFDPESVTANAGADKTICENESVTLTASGGTTYLWNTGETTQSIEVSPTVTTSYTVTVYYNGVSDTDDVIVNVNPNPIAEAGQDRTILHGDSITLTASGGSEYIWSTGETTQEIIAQPSETTTYTVEVLENDCTDFDQVTVIVGVSASVNGEPTICQGQSTTLYAAGGSYFLWNTGETTQSIEVSPTQTTTYSVVVSNNSSSDEADITVNVNLLPAANAGDDVTIESGQNVTLTATGGNSYLWSNGQTTQSISVSPTDSTVYTVETFVNGCSNTDDVNVTVVEQVNASAGQDLEICFGESTTLTASGGEFFTWSTGEETASISVSPVETTVYTVSVSNGISTQNADVMVAVSDCQAIDIEPQDFDFDFIVYPNPTDGQINIKLSGLENISSIHVSDILGKVLTSESFEPEAGTVINKQYDLSSLSKGIYFITFKQSGEAAITKKIILQ